MIKDIFSSSYFHWTWHCIILKTLERVKEAVFLYFSYFDFSNKFILKKYLQIFIRDLVKNISSFKITLLNWFCFSSATEFSWTFGKMIHIHITESLRKQSLYIKKPKKTKRWKMCSIFLKPSQEQEHHIRYSDFQQ